MPKILYLTQTYAAARKALARFPRDIVQARPLGSVMGARGEIVLIEPPNRDLSERERAAFAELVENARTKTRDVDGPVILGELL